MIEDQEQSTHPVNADDKNAPGLNLLAYFIPLIGVIVYLANKDDNPIKARSIGRATLAGFVYWLVYLVFKSLIYR